MSANPTDHVITLDGVYNLRELGGYPTADHGETKTHRLLRSGDLGKMTREAQQALVDYGLKTVVDLRDPAELAQLADPFATFGSVTYLHLPFFDDAGEKMGPPDLTKSKGWRYLRWFDGYPDNVAAIFRGIAGAKDGVTLFHCVAGKDRTGLVAGMMLALAGVPDQTVDADYAASYDLLKPWTAMLREEAEKQGEDMSTFERRAETFPETMQEVLDGFRSQYGGVAGYLRKVGLTEEEIVALEARLIE